MRWMLSIYRWCEGSWQRVARGCGTILGRANGSDCLQPPNMKIVAYFQTTSQKSDIWKYKCRKLDEELMTLEVLPSFLLGLFTQVLNSLQQASAHHASSGMQTPFPDVELQINYLYTSIYVYRYRYRHIYLYVSHRQIDRQTDNF